MRRVGLLNGEPRITQIQEIVAAGFGITLSAMHSKRQTRAVARPRQVAMYLCTELTSAPRTKISKMFGRDHSTVKDSVELIRDLVNSDIEFAGLVETLRQRVSPLFHNG